jgi:sugar/nucleoside kinase (ribokinase family)
MTSASHTPIETSGSSHAAGQDARKPFEIMIAGETNLDLILYGLPEEMPVEREILGTGFVSTLGGSSSILAHNLAALGVRIGFVSEIGEDALGEVARKFLAEADVDLSHFRRKSGATTGVTLVLPHGKRRHILTYPGVMAEMTVNDLPYEYLSSGRHFHLSSLFLQTGLHAGLPNLFDRLRGQGITVSLDTNDDPTGQWRGVLDLLLDRIDLLLPNEDEVLRIAGAATLEEAMDALALRIPLIVVKCGSRGALVRRRERSDWVAPLTVTPVDTIGAGDSFNAGFLSAWVRGADPLQAARMGNITGALSTLRPGGIGAYRDKQLRMSFLEEHGAVS